MALALYGHPFASFVWKPLIALHERGIDFEFRMVDPDHPENAARIARISPTGQFPALVDGAREITESNAVIEYLDLHHGSAPPMVPPDPREALEARMLADVFDDYVHAPMQRIVGDALRPQAERDPRGVADAHALLDRACDWLEPRLLGKDWAALGRFTLADCAAARPCSMPTGSIRSPRPAPPSPPTAPASSLAPRSRKWWTRPGPIAPSSR